MKEYKQPTLEEVKLLKEDIMVNSVFIEEGGMGVEDLTGEELPPTPETP